MKKPYVYVEARGWFSTPSVTGNRAEGTLEGPISFDSVKVDATNADEAYQLGAAAMDTKRQTPDDADATYHHATGQFLNDYVVEVA